MNDYDEGIRKIRSDVPEPDREAVDAARRAFMESASAKAGRVSLRGRLPRLRSPRLALPLVGLAGAIALTVVLLQVGTGDHVATASDIEDVAKLAAGQAGHVRSLARGQYLLTRFTTVVVVKTTYTQGKLDRLAASATGDGAGAEAGPRLVYPSGTTGAEIRRRRRVAVRRYASSHALKLASLPSPSVSATGRSTTTEWSDGAHAGGGSASSPTAVTYGSAAQSETARLINDARFSSGIAELEQLTVASALGRFDSFTWPAAEVRSLPTDPAGLARTLRSQPLPSVLSRDRRPPTGDDELFHVAIGLLRSPFASPAQRAAVVRMLGGIRGVRVENRAADVRARRGIGVTYAKVEPRPELVLDRRDSRVLGVNYQVDRTSALKGGDLTSLPLADEARIGMAFDPALVVQGAPVCDGRSPSGRTIESYCPSKVRPVR